MEHIVSHDLPDGGRHIIVKQEDGPTLGYGIAVIEGGTLLLETIQVLRRHRGKGFGRQIINSLLQWGTENGATELTGVFTPDTGEEEPVRAFYEKMGIEITPERKLRKTLP